MKRFIISCFLILTLMNTAWSATVYVKPGSADPTTATQHKSGAAGCDDASGWTDGSDLEAALTAAGSNGTLNICSGTYTGTMIDTSDGLDTTAGNQTINGIGTVEIDATGRNDHAISLVNAGTTTITGIKFTGTDSGKYAIFATYPFALHNVEISGSDRAISTTANFTMNQCSIYDTASSAYNVYINGVAVVGSINYSIFKGCHATALYINAAQTITIDNSMFIGNKFRAIQSPAAYAGVTAIHNSLFAGNAWYDGTYHVIENASTASGTITTQNCLLLPNPYTPTTKFLSGVTDGGNNVYKSPGFLAGNKTCLIAVGVDDGGNYSYFNDLSIAASEYGAKAYFAFAGTPTYHTDNSYWNDAYTIMKAAVARGHEIASHSDYSTDLTAESPGDLADQLVQSKSNIESRIGGGYSVTSIVYPSGLTNASVITAAQAAGYTAGRSITGDWQLSSIDIYKLMSRSAPALFGTNESTIQRNAAAYFEGISWVGGLGILYAHNDFSAAQWRLVLKALQGSNCKSVTLKEMDAYIRTGTTGDGETWTRTLNSTPNYHLRTGSSAINAGANVSLTIDYDGKGVPYSTSPDIGVYEYKSMNIRR